MAELLVVWHSRSGSVARLRDHVLAGAARAGGGVVCRSLAAPDAGADEIEATDGLVLLTPANFGAVSGLVKDFLERIYPWFEEIPNRHPGLPYAMVAKGASDASGAVRDITRIATGLRWRQVLAPLVIEGALTLEFLDAAEELGATMAAGVTERLW